MAWRIVRLAAGRIQIRVMANKCKAKDAGLPCENYCRKEAGAVYCDEHRERENAGCAAHDKIGCREDECRS